MSMLMNEVDGRPYPTQRSNQDGFRGCTKNNAHLQLEDRWDGSHLVAWWRVVKWRLGRVGWWVEEKNNHWQSERGDNEAAEVTCTYLEIERRHVFQYVIKGSLSDPFLCAGHGPELHGQWHLPMLKLALTKQASSHRPSPSVFLRKHEDFRSRATPVPTIRVPCHCGGPMVVEFRW